MKIEEGLTYKCENGYIVTIVRNSLPYYKFSCDGSSATDTDGFVVSCSEVWNEVGVACHFGCGYDIIQEYNV